MSFKTITIKDKVYRALSKVKGADESFSDLFERMLSEKKPDLMKYAGCLRGAKEDKERVRLRMKDFRNSFEKSFKEKMTRVSR